MIKKRVEALVKLGEWMQGDPDALELAKLKSRRDNNWFDLKSQNKAIRSIANHLLDPDNIEQWLSNYNNVNSGNPKIVGLITAGNIPAVGFHDLLCIYVSGHTAHVKLSEKDAHLLPAFFNKLTEYDKGVTNQIHFVDKLNEIDALIATGSDNSKRYFKYYFGHLPHIIRGNRNSLAMIDHSMDEDQIYQLGTDVFDFYGLGCRSVSQILIPADFNENKLLDAWDDFHYVMDNSKYHNNFKYNYATSILNREEFKTNNFLILKENNELVSRIACLHFTRYGNLDEVNSYLEQHKNNIQICVSNLDHTMDDIPMVQPGKSQQPGPMDYADRVDTLQFLNQLS